MGIPDFIKLYDYLNAIKVISIFGVGGVEWYGEISIRVSKNDYIFFNTRSCSVSNFKCLYVSIIKKRKVRKVFTQQYNKVLSEYEQSILSTSQYILTQLDSFIEDRIIDRDDLIYINYESLNSNQIQYAYYVQTYTSLDGKIATKDLVGNESIPLNYAPGLIYFNSSIALIKELLVQNADDIDIVVTPELEKRLQVVVEIISLNTSIYEKYIIKDFDPLSNESILTRIQLQSDLITSGTKQAELDLELSRLDK